MPVQYSEIQELLRSRADLHARLNLMPYDGTPEIKERGDKKYLYVRKRVAGKQTSTYVGAYTEELYNLLLRNARETREIRKSLRSIEKQLAEAGYSEDELSINVVNNIAFARANMKMNIYDQAVLEGVAFAMRDCYEIAKDLGINITETKICGGGAKSPLWRKIMANVLNINVNIIESEEGPGLGGAMLAAVACCEYASVQEAADKIVKVIGTEKPDPALAAKYDKKYAKFKEIYPTVKGLYDTLKA